MTIRQKLEKLASEKNAPCVTVSFNTHKTHPANKQDEVMLKNLLKEAEERVVAEFGKRPVAPLLEKIETVPNDIDINYNLKSLHIFLSNETKEIIGCTWSANKNAVHISETFAVRPLIKAYSRSEEYLILLLSQGGVQLYEALNDGIVEEIRNDDFPFPETRHYITHSDKASDPKQIDNMVREFLNKVDKAVVKVQNETDLQCVVICTEDNYSRLMQVADKPGIYHGYHPVNYNNVAIHHIAGQGWEVVKSKQRQRRSDAINEMQEAVAQGKVLTDLQEIFQASIDGRGELLIVNEAFVQPVLMKTDRTFELVKDVTKPDVIDDITSNIAWNVLSRNGRVVFTQQDHLKSLGNIVLKTRY